MNVRTILGTLGATIVGISTVSLAHAQEIEPELNSSEFGLREQLTVHGDFTLFGNTIGFDCNAALSGPDALVPGIGDGTASVDCSGAVAPDDTSPDLFWTIDGDMSLADSSLKDSEQARSSAILDFGAGVEPTVRYARLYWAGFVSAEDDAALNAGAEAGSEVGGDVDVTLCTTSGCHELLAEQTSGRWEVVNDNEAESGYFYQSSVDVTHLVTGAGSYQVSGIRTLNFPDHDAWGTMGAWWVVVIYDDANDTTQREITLFDGLTMVSHLTEQEVTVTGFTVPSGFDAKLGVVSYEGDVALVGDSVLVNGTALSNELNPVDNFFNGTRSWLGVASTSEGDRPYLSGSEGSLSSFDLDVVDITSTITAGRNKSATVLATSTSDAYGLGALVTSITTLSPSFGEYSRKGVRKSDGTTPATYLPGDGIEYGVKIVNTGNDVAVNLTLTDDLPSQVTLDAATVLVGTRCADADNDGFADEVSCLAAPSGGTTVTEEGGVLTVSFAASLPIGQSVFVQFAATIDAGTEGRVCNTGTISASGQRGADLTHVDTNAACLRTPGGGDDGVGGTGGEGGEGGEGGVDAGAGGSAEAIGGAGGDDGVAGAAGEATEQGGRTGSGGAATAGSAGETTGTLGGAAGSSGTSEGGTNGEAGTTASAGVAGLDPTVGEAGAAGTTTSGQGGQSSGRGGASSQAGETANAGTGQGEAGRDATAGTDGNQAGADGDDTPDVGASGDWTGLVEGGGCGCSVPQSSSNPAAWLVLGALGLVLRRRRSQG